MKIFILVLLTVLSEQAIAYPEFIGYGYSNCTACHYNTHGGGPLTDYGRALFSQEIAARPFISSSISDEELAEKSGFVPGVTLPYWLRPSLKYRGLWLTTSPQSAQTFRKWIDMQREANLVVILDKAQRHFISATYGLLSRPQDLSGHGESEGFWRELYVRSLWFRKLYVSIGLMDKVFGLRLVDHTAFSRRLTGNAQYDQVHAVSLSWISPSWDITIQPFFGRLDWTPEKRQEGYTIMSEFEIFHSNRLGFSFMEFKKNEGTYKRFAIHDRWGFSEVPGSSLLTEIGLFENKDPGSDARLGNYGLIEGMIKLGRGYNLVSQLERNQAESYTGAVETQRWSFGFLMFPFQRIETRAMVIQEKSFGSEVTIPDAWSLQGQIHVSY